MPPLSPYQKRLLLLLSVATFFEGFDFFALAQILPNLSTEFALNPSEEGLLVAIINIGPVLAYFLIRQADRYGRKPILTLTIAGYTLFTLLSGLAPNIWLFGAAQLIARIFLIGEWAIAMIFAAEEFPAERRGFVIGIIQGFTSLGAVTCAGIVPWLLTFPTGWRTVFFIGALPLILVSFARRSIRETSRFLESQNPPATPDTSPATAPLISQTSLFAIWSSPWRNRMLLLALIWALTYICTTTAVLFWKEFAIRERAWTDGQVGLALSLAAITSMPFVFFSGRLLDRIGRRRGAIVIFLAAALGVFGSYTLVHPVLLAVSLTIGIFGTSAVLPILNAYTAELFPTPLRSNAFAWSNNLLGRLGAIISPLLIGLAAGFTGWGPAVAATTVGPILALLLILRFLPETRGLELEASAALSPQDAP